jgi:hypothetical protein
MAQTNPRYQWSVKENWRNPADTAEGMASETYNLVDQTTKAVVWSKTYPPNLVVAGKDYTDFLVGADDVATALNTAPDVLLGLTNVGSLSQTATTYGGSGVSAGYTIGGIGINTLAVVAAAAVLWLYFKRR